MSRSITAVLSVSGSVDSACFRSVSRSRCSSAASGLISAETLRTAVMLRDIRELSYQEIADSLHLPEGTVKSRINRGRTELARQIRRLRTQYEEAGTGGGSPDGAGGLHEPRSGVSG